MVKYEFDVQFEIPVPTAAHLHILYRRAHIVQIIITSWYGHMFSNILLGYLSYYPL